MKPLHYINKYYNPHTRYFNAGDEFINDLMLDFATLLATSHGTKSILGFENCINAIKMKWDSIMNKTGGALTEGKWKYFYATQIVPMREMLFPDEIKARKARKEENEKQRQEREKEEDMFFNFWYDFVFKDFVISSAEKHKYLIHFERLKLNIDTATVRDVKSAWKNMLIIHHPDKGGNTEMTSLINDAKDQALRYLSNK